MLSEWVLVLVLTSGSGALDVEHIEFNDEKSCREAVTVLSDSLEGKMGYAKYRLTCVKR